MCRNHCFYSVFSPKLPFGGSPPKKETLFVNTTAFFFSWSFFSAFLFFCLCCVQFFWIFFFERNEKRSTKQPRKKQDHKMQTRKPLSLVYKKSRQHRHKIIQLHCLDCKQATQETQMQEQKQFNTKNKLPFYQLNFKKHQNCRENTVFFHRLKAKQDTRKRKQSKKITNNKTNIETEKGRNIHHENENKRTTEKRTSQT